MNALDAFEQIRNYPRHWVTIALERGWDFQSHVDALVGGDEDRISMTHPANELTEDEVEAA
jgi:hypothetical protein